MPDIGLLVLLALAIPGLAIAAFVMVIGTREQLRRLEARLGALESYVGALAYAGPPPGAVAPPVPLQPGGPPPEHRLEDIPERFRDQPPIPDDIPERFRDQPPEPAALPEKAEEPAAPPPPGGPQGPGAVPPPPPPAAPEIGFEERFGTRWVVWVGGLALALGGIFLVRYSIEQGYFGPETRLVLSGLLAALLVAAGEKTRRQEQRAGFAGLPSAHVPSILTAAGTTIAYATVYAAYGLYGFIGPAAAFILLGAVALATLAAALLHGPALAGLGVVGAYVAPLLVASNAPNYWALTIYLAVVTAAAFTLARARMWRWLAITAVVFGTLWMFPGINDMRVDSLTPHAVHAVAGFALVCVFIVAGFLLGPSAEPGRIDAVSSGALAAYVFAAAVLVLVYRHDGLALFAFAGLAVAAVAVAWRAEAATGAVPVSALLTALVIVHWAVRIPLDQLIAPGGPVAGAVPEPSLGDTRMHLVLGAGFAALYGAVGFLAQGRSERAAAPTLWATTSVLAPLAILAALYYRIAGFERSIPFAGLALVLAALYAVATELLSRREQRPGMPAAAAIYAAGATAALALAFTLAMEKGWLTVGLSLMVPGIAWVADKRPLPVLRPLAALIAVLVLVRVGWEPRIVGADIGTRPIFNWLLYGYGLPALAFWLGGTLLRRRADDAPARTVDALAILFTVLTCFLEIRHLMTGELFRESTALSEVALQVSVGLALAIGLERLRQLTHSVVHDVGAIIIAALTFAGIALGLCLMVNPMFTGEPVGGRFFNLILLGYGLPAALAVVLALVARTTRPMGYRVLAVVASVALVLLYLSLEVRALFHGPVLTRGPTTDAEIYTYSAVWLAFGVLLLLVGIALRSQPARLASAAIVLVSVAKVFLYDLAGLEGFFKALSFIGLGLVLVGIGLLYQRLLFPRRPAPPASAPPALPPAGGEAPA